MASNPPVVVAHTVTPLVSPVVRVKGKSNADQIRQLKQHVIHTSTHVSYLKTQMALSQRALAACNPADVNAVVVPGYPPSAV